MNCGNCNVTNRCVNDGDRIGTAKYLPCHRDSFYDPKHNFCDRENGRVVANECYFCGKSICKNTAECNHPEKNKERAEIK